VDEDAELDVDDQSGKGRFVDVEEVQISNSEGLVVVCSLQGKRLLGWAPVPRSRNDRFARIALEEPITATGELLVLLLADNGDRQLDWAIDRVVTDDDDDIDELEVESVWYRYRR
jgi:hypothetical protein